MSAKVPSKGRRIAVGVLLLAALMVAFFRYGHERVLFLLLGMACAYLNALFLSEPARAFKRRDGKGIAILIGAVAANAALLFWMDFDPLIALLVWLPALAGGFAKKIFPG